VNVSFSPVVDVNSNPRNPVIGERSFGEDKYNVAAKGIQYMKGLQDGGVMACAKHFPGHGDTDEDSHKTLPVVNASRAQLDSSQLYPFRKLINAGVGSVMVAHLSIPSLDTTQNLPTTLSKKTVTGLLKVGLGFKGLSFTDALNMKGVTNYYKTGEVDLKALLAGNDVLLFSGDVPAAIGRIKEAMISGALTQDEIDGRVRKILQAKYWMGLSVWHPVNTHHLVEDLNSSEALYLKQRLIESSLTLVRNKEGLLPLQEIDTFRFASIAIGTDGITPFQEMLSRYISVEHYQIRKDAPDNDYGQLLEQVKNCNVVFVALQGMSRQASAGFGVTENSKEFIQKLQARCKVVLTVFGSPYALRYFENSSWLLEAYQDDEMNQQLSAQLLFGGIPSKGKLPVSASLNTMRGLGDHYR
jgi:beta-glucosidase-like glycosyl hydrolase